MDISLVIMLWPECIHYCHTHGTDNMLLGCHCFCILLYCSCIFIVNLAKKSLHQLKQLYLELKEDVFGSGNKYGYGFDTCKMEEVLRRNFGTDMKMNSVTEPK